MLKVKWENIALIVFGSFFMYCIISHMIKNGFDGNILMFEFLFYGLTLLIAYISISNVRKIFLKK